MLATYGLDVLDPAVTPRRLWSLVGRLPAGSVQNPRSPISWSVEAHLLAAIVDGLAGLTYVTLRAHGAKMAKVPKPLPRPGRGAYSPAPSSKPAAKPKTSWAELAQALMAGAK